jgi:hypothetical protein
LANTLYLTNSIGIVNLIFLVKNPFCAEAIRAIQKTLALKFKTRGAAQTCRITITSLLPIAAVLRDKRQTAAYKAGKLNSA